MVFLVGCTVLTDVTFGAQTALCNAVASVTFSRIQLLLFFIEMENEQDLRKHLSAFQEYHTKSKNLRYIVFRVYLREEGKYDHRQIVCNKQ